MNRLESRPGRLNTEPQLLPSTTTPGAAADRHTTDRPARGVRPLTPDDIARITELHGLTLSEGRVSPGMERFLRDVFFGHPWRDDAYPSLGYVDSRGRLVGCLGVMPRPMTLDGERVRVLVSHNFVVDPEHRRGLTAIQLMRGLLRYEADLVVSEPNEAGRTIGEALGARTIECRSRRWLKVLRPAAFAVHLARRSGLPDRAARALAAVATIPDALARSLPAARVPAAPIGEDDVELTGSLLADLAERHTRSQALRPTYTAESAAWMLAALRRSRRDQVLRARAVRVGDDLVGWYVYYSRPGGLGPVLQLGAAADAGARVLEHLFRDALREGNAGVSGAPDPRWTDDLAATRCLVRDGRSWVVAFVSDPRLTSVLESPEAFFGRMEGEGWLRFAY